MIFLNSPVSPGLSAAVNIVAAAISVANTVTSFRMLLSPAEDHSPLDEVVASRLASAPSIGVPPAFDSIRKLLSGYASSRPVHFCEVSTRRLASPDLELLSQA